MTLQESIIEGLLFQENDLGNPVFTLAGVDYPCVASMSEFKRNLEYGGFRLDKMLTLSVRLKDEHGNDMFTILPSAQDIINYNALQYRIQSTKTSPTGAYIRIVAYGINNSI